MLGIFKTIRAKLLFSFFMFFLIVGIIVLGNIWFSLREANINRIRTELKDINLNFQTEKKLEKDFYLQETIDTNFYINYANNGSSKILDERVAKVKAIQKSLDFLENSNALSSQKENIQQLKRHFEEYETTFKKVVKLISQKGFKDFGAIGKMRESIHKLEEVITGNNLNSMLMLRRHEKDFLLRKQDTYLKKHRKEVDRLKRLVGEPSKKFSVEQYSNRFQQMAKLEKEIGYDDSHGQKKILKDITTEIENLIEPLNTQAQDRIASIQIQINLIRISIIVVALILFIFLVFYTTRIISKPISGLSNSIDTVIRNNFDPNVQIAEIESKDEIGSLAKDFKKMLGRVQNSLQEIQEKSDELEKNNTIMTDGINYAQRIQKAILPDFELNESRFFKTYYLLYKPRYIVSGDFYWYTEIDNSAYIAVVDCTGKGVAGAFMSMIGNTLLNRIINERKTSDPAFILETLNTEVRLALRQDRKANEDRMDICLCQIENIDENNRTRKVTFAGANQSLFYGDREIHEIKGVARSIGGKLNINNDLNFENHTIQLGKGDYLYLTTNGLIAQYNPHKERFGQEKLNTFFKNNLHQKAEKQKELLESLVEEHAQGVKQNDDITILVLKS